MKMIIAAVLATGLVAACTPSENTCNLMYSAKASFDVFVSEGEIDARYIPEVTTVYDIGVDVCEAPAGTYDQAKMIEVATQAYIVIRRAMRNSGVAYTADMKKLEGILKEVQNAK